MDELIREWEHQEPQLRRDWEQRFGHMGLGWEEIKDAYRFGWLASQRPEFAGYSWNEVEKDLSEHWYNPQWVTEESAWDYVREAAEAGWRKAREARKRIV